MAITPGTKLGSYEIMRLIGAGGMGDLYRARDTKLDRDVANKVLPAVLYEMLTGKRAFAAEDVSDTLAAVLRAAPDVDALPAGTPHAVRQALRLCLTKELKGRVRDIGDVALAIDGAFDRTGSGLVLNPRGSSKRCRSKAAPQ